MTIDRRRNGGDVLKVSLRVRRTHRWQIIGGLSLNATKR
jgi:hypothetical protein